MQNSIVNLGQQAENIVLQCLRDRGWHIRARTNRYIGFEMKYRKKFKNELTELKSMATVRKVRSHKRGIDHFSHYFNPSVLNLRLDTVSTYTALFPVSHSEILSVLKIGKS